jgi:hypothetical protein
LLTLEQLKLAVHKKGVTKTNIALLCVAAGGATKVTGPQVKKLAMEAGVKGAKDINFTAHLHGADDKVFKTPDGWELTEAGRTHVASLVAAELSVSPAATEAQALRKLLPQLKNEDARAFLLEAVVCAEQSLHRAAVVLSWVGAMALMHDYGFAKHLAAINAEALKRDPKWKAAKTTDHLGKLSEAAFLEIAEAVGMIGRNVKQELEACLKLRNGCGHPNSLKIGPNKVASHLETLALNVYAVFG